MTNEEAKYGVEVFSLVRSIIEKFQNGFYSNKETFYDPQTDPSAEGTDETDAKAQWQIPDFIKEPSPGIELSFE